jgi:O-methyltransferase domain
MLTQLSPARTRGLVVDQISSTQLLHMILGVPLNQAIYACAKLGIADLLADGPKPYTDLAAATGTHSPSLYRVLRALASANVLDEPQRGSFALTPIGECLRTGAPGSLRRYATVHGSPLSQVWTGFLHTLQTGETAFSHVFGAPVFQYLQGNGDALELFHAAMAERTAIDAAAIVEAHDFSGISTLVDVGGGRGTLLAAILRANPDMRGVLLDVPDAVANPDAALSAELRERCQLVGGNFLAGVPEGGDAYLLKSILHDWDDERALAILRNCRRAMSSNSRLLMVEMVIPPGQVPLLVALHDLLMLAVAGGKERTAGEFTTLLDAAGFELTRITPTQAAVSIIEALPRRRLPRNLA